MTSKPIHLSLAALAMGAALSAGPVFAQAPDLSGLHQALRLTPAQEPAWKAYVAAIAPDPGAESRRRSAAMMSATLTTPRRVDLIDAEMEADMASVRRQGEAVKAFYASLTPDQQRVFDRQTAPGAQGGGAGSEGQPLRDPGAGARPQY